MVPVIGAAAGVHVRRRLHFDVYALGLRVRLLQIRLDAVDGIMHLLAGYAGDKAHPHVDQQTVGAHIHGQGVARALYRGVRLDDAPDVLRLVGVHPFSHQERFGPLSEGPRHAHQQQADDDRSDAVEVGVVEQVAEEYAQERERQAQHGRAVLEHHGAEDHAIDDMEADGIKFPKGNKKPIRAIGLGDL